MAHTSCIVLENRNNGEFLQAEEAQACASSYSHALFSVSISALLVIMGNLIRQGVYKAMERCGTTIRATKAAKVQLRIL